MASPLAASSKMLYLVPASAVAVVQWNFYICNPLYSVMCPIVNPVMSQTCDSNVCYTISFCIYFNICSSK